MPNNIEINLTGASYQSRSRPLSAQITRNLYPEPQQDPGAKSPFVLHSFPGSKVWGDTALGVDRGLFEHLGVLYQVQGQTLYSYNSNGVATSLGTVTGFGRAIFTALGTNVIFTTGESYNDVILHGTVEANIAWIWNGTTLAQITDADLETPRTCASLNTQVIYDGDAGRWVSSDVGDATSIDGLNYATAESNADDLLRVFVFGQRLFLFGDKSTETWWNSGVGSPPFDRVEGGIFTVGLAARHSVASNDRAMYWLGDDREVYASLGGTPEPVTTSAISRQFRLYDVVEDAIAWTWKWDGQQFYQITFPAEDKTWIYSESGFWFEASSGVGGMRHQMNSFVKAYGKHLMADATTGCIWELAEDTFTDRGNTIVRHRDSAPVHGGLFGAQGKNIEMSRFELILEGGTGIETGQGSDPEIMLQFSDDGGRTFGNPRAGKLGKRGEYQRKVEWHACGRFTERIVRLKVSDPVDVSIHSAVMDAEVCV